MLEVRYFEMCCTYSCIFLRLNTLIGPPAKFSPFSSECQIFRKEVKTDIWTISGVVCASSNRTIVHHFFLLIFAHFFLLIFARPLTLVFIKSCLGPVSFGRHIEKGLYPSCCKNWFYGRKKEGKIVMQLSILK